MNLKLNSPLGRVMYGISILMAIIFVILVWTYFGDGPLIFKIVFTVIAVGIVIQNGRVAFGRGGSE